VGVQRYGLMNEERDTVQTSQFPVSALGFYNSMVVQNKFGNKAH